MADTRRFAFSLVSGFARRPVISSTRMKKNTEIGGLGFRRTWDAVYPLCHHKDLFCSRERICSLLFANSRPFGISTYCPKTTILVHSSWPRISSTCTQTSGFARIHSIFLPTVEKQHKRSASYEK